MSRITDEQLQMFIDFAKTDVEECDEREKFLHVLKLSAFEELKELRKQCQKQSITSIEFEDNVKSEVLKQYERFLRDLPDWLQTDNWDGILTWINEILDEADVTNNSLVDAKESLMNRILIHKHILKPETTRRLNFIYLISIVILEMKIKQLGCDKGEE